MTCAQMPGSSMHVVLIVLVSTVQLAFSQGNPKNNEITVGRDRNVTLSLLTDGSVQCSTINVKPIPENVKYSYLSTLNFEKSAIVSLTLTSLIMWRKKPVNVTGEFGWIVQKVDDQRKLVWRKATDDYTWTNGTSVVCRYLEVQNIFSSGLIKSQSLEVNTTVTFNADIIAFWLKEVPDSEWCNFSIQFDVSVLPANYCQTEETFYCKTSLQCLNVGAKCNGIDDCYSREDELNCQEVAGLATGSSVTPALVSVLVVLSAITAVAIVSAAIYCYFKKHSILPLRRRGLFTKENHLYDYPKFGDDEIALNARVSPGLSHNVDSGLEPTYKAHADVYDELGVYSRVITTSRVT